MSIFSGLLRGRSLQVLALVAFVMSSGSLVAQTGSILEGVISSEDGLALPGATVEAKSTSITRSVLSDAEGWYRFPSLPAGNYRIAVSLDGFATEVTEDFELLINSRPVFDIELTVGSSSDVITVHAEEPLLQTRTSDTGGVVTPAQIETLPVDGRDYLDLMKLVPGVNVKPEQGRGSLGSVPILGESPGAAIYLVDGMPNRDDFNRGPATQFSQDAIQEFEVITGGYKAEYGHGSGGVISVLTRSGSNQFRGLGFVYLRDDSLDAENSLEPGAEVPPLSRENFGVTLGGSLVDDKIFYFGSAERVDEDRLPNFAFTEETPLALRDAENSFDGPNVTEESRWFLKLDEQVNDSHRLSQQISYTDTRARAIGRALPSRRSDSDEERFMLGLRDSAILGADSSYLFEAHLQYRDDHERRAPAHPAAGPDTTFFIFTTPTTFGVFGDAGSTQFGNGDTEGALDQSYTSFSPRLTRGFGEHDLATGLEFQRIEVDGIQSSNISNQLFATADNYARFGPVDSGFVLTGVFGPLSPEDAQVRLRNTHTGLFIQDDWRVADDWTLNLGLRWDYDSEFDDDDNYSPRLGFAWTPTDTTVVTGSAGIFFDRYTVQQVGLVPEFGGADMRFEQDASFPQGFYNVTTIIPWFIGFCVNPTASHAEVAGSPCPFPSGPEHLGFDFLNQIVADGHAPIPAESVITQDNVFELSGLTADEYLARVNELLADSFFPGGWYWGRFGTLAHGLIPPGRFPTEVDPSFETPSTEAYHLGVQQQVGRHQVIGLDLHHRRTKNILGIRQTNLKYESRIPGLERSFEEPYTDVEVQGWGPWFDAEYDAAILSYTRRMHDGFSLSAHYTYTDAVDNGNGYPSDNYVGVVPEVTDPSTGQNNASGSFVAGNGNLIAQAGTFSNGPDLDRGRSSLPEHALLLFGTVDLPYDFQLSAIYRNQSGLQFSSVANPSDPDGNQFSTQRDLTVPRNSLEGPSYENLDLRLTKGFDLGDRVRMTVLLEFFNVTNEQNASEVELLPNSPNRVSRQGDAVQVLPGREGQFGLRFEFR